MTVSEAYTLLRQRWTGQSFAIKLECWHYDHSETSGDDRRGIEWSIWQDEAQKHHRGPTLDSAVRLALPTPPDLAAVDADVGEACDRDAESRLAHAGDVERGEA
jgi:hypothetical protein